MTLDEYFKKYCIVIKKWAISNGLNTDTLYAYRKGKIVPSRKMANKIVKATHGEVTYEDLGI